MAEESIAAPFVFAFVAGRIEVEGVLWIWDGEFGETAHFAHVSAEAGESVVEGLALLGGNATGVGGDTITEGKDDERCKFATDEKDEAEG